MAVDVQSKGVIWKPYKTQLDSNVTLSARVAMSVSDRTRKVLWARAGGRCSRCKTELVFTIDSDTSSIIGEECHIRPQGTSGSRADGSADDRELHEYSNLLLLCRICHKLVDDTPEIYPPERLSEIKAKHEEWVAYQLDANRTDPGYSPRFASYLTLCRKELNSHLKKYPCLDDRAMQLHVFRLFFMGLFDKIEKDLISAVSTPSDERKAQDVLEWLATYKEYCSAYVSPLEPFAKREDTRISPYGSNERDILSSLIARAKAGLCTLAP